MIPGRFYMHEKALDVCIWVRRVSKSPISQLEVHGTWVNLGYTGEPRFLPLPYLYQVMHLNNIKEWHDVTDRMNIIRKEAGLPK